jgi:hypothetical protein
MFAIPVPLLRLLPDPIQHPDASAQLGRRNIVEQFVSKLERRSFDLFNHTLSAGCQMHCFATTILRRIFSRYPTVAFQPMQKRHQSWFFNTEVRGNFGLGQRTRRHRQMHKRSPFGLTQTHRFEPLVQFEPPGAGGAVQERTEYIDIPVQSKLVSMLTNSNPEQCQCHHPSRS